VSDRLLMNEYIYIYIYNNNNNKVIVMLSLRKYEYFSTYMFWAVPCGCLIRSLQKMALSTNFVCRSGLRHCLSFCHQPFSLVPNPLSLTKSLSGSTYAFSG
jgi:hypothetical protein